MNIEIAALAEADLEAIYRRIRDDSPARAIEWRRGLLRAAQALEQFPHRCPLAPETSISLEIRQLRYRRYRVLFTITHDTVHILHIRHSARQPLVSGATDEGAEGEDG